MYAARQFATSDLDFIILDMEHQAMDFERLQTFFLGNSDRAQGVSGQERAVCDHCRPGRRAQRLKEGFRVVSLGSGGLEAQMDAALKIARSNMPR